jgi:hypothetical protein
MSKSDTFPIAISHANLIAHAFYYTYGNANSIAIAIYVAHAYAKSIGYANPNKAGNVILDPLHK